jgi:hypothetical protein
MGKTRQVGAQFLLPDHEVKNLFVTDVGLRLSSGQNPTWTILALSMRASDYIVSERKAGDSRKWRNGGMAKW